MPSDPKSVRCVSRLLDAPRVIAGQGALVAAAISVVLMKGKQVARGGGSGIDWTRVTSRRWRGRLGGRDRLKAFPLCTASLFSWMNAKVREGEVW